MKKKKSIVTGVIILGLVVAIMVFFSQGMRIQFENEVKRALKLYSKERAELLTENDVEKLPEPVQKYIRYSGAIGKAKVWNFRVEMGGKMRNDHKSGWMNIKADQYNFINSPVRMFYIQGRMMGIPAYGLHAYKNEEGIMLIKVLGIFPVVDQRGKEMNVSDTVTIFNDMCVFAPATLIDKRITWESIDKNTVKAIFVNGKNKVSATLYFNDKGQLVNFISEDRYRGYEKAKWSTPIYQYEKFGEMNLSANASAMWHFPDREFSYAEFAILKVLYNVPEFKE